MVLKNYVGSSLDERTVEDLLGSEFLDSINSFDPNYTLSFDSSTGMDTAEITFKLSDRTVIVKLPSLVFPAVQIDFAFTDSYQAYINGEADYNIFTEDRKSNQTLGFAKGLRNLMFKLPQGCFIALLGTTPGRSEIYLRFANELSKAGYYMEAGGLMEETM